MKLYDEFKAEMAVIQQQMVEAKRKEHTNSLKKVKPLCKEFSFNAYVLRNGENSEIF